VCIDLAPRVNLQHPASVRTHTTSHPLSWRQRTIAPVGRPPSHTIAGRIQRGTFVALALALALCAAGASARRPAAQGTTVDRIVAQLTPDEIVGQLVVVDYAPPVPQGRDVSPTSDIATLIRDYHVGGVFISATNGNIDNAGETAAEVATLANGLQQRAFEATARVDPANGASYFLPLFVAVDNEGDGYPLTNLTGGFTELPNNMTIGATWKKQRAQDVGTVLGRELSAVGINMLLGPVVDVLAEPRAEPRGDIGTRSFGGVPAWVGALGRAYIRGVHEGSDHRILAVAKHFPGHGGSDRSTDEEVPLIFRSLEQLRLTDLKPFAATASADAQDADGVADAIMVSHIKYLDSPNTPVSIDPTALGQLMGLPEFAAWRRDHLLIADALGVPALRKWYAQQGSDPFPTAEVARAALMAGADVLPLVGFYPDDAHRGWREYQLPTIEDTIVRLRNLYRTDPAFRRRADDAVRHVISAKLSLYPNLTIDDVRVDVAAANATVGADPGHLQPLFDDAATLIFPGSAEDLRARTGRPPAAGERIVVVECWLECYGTPLNLLSGAIQRRLLERYGPGGAQRIAASDVSTITFAQLDAWLTRRDDPANAPIGEALRSARWIVLALADYNPLRRPVSRAPKRLLDNLPLELRNANILAIAFSKPYPLDGTEIGKLAGYLAVYSKTDGAIDAAIALLMGDLNPRGHPPIDVEGAGYYVDQSVQPDPNQALTVAVFGDANAIDDAGVVGLTAGPIHDRNGNPVPDGTVVAFSIAGEDGHSQTISANTVDGVAGVAAPISGAGTYTATATVAGIASEPLTIRVRSSTTSPEPQGSLDRTEVGSDGGVSTRLLAVIVAPIAATVAGAAVVGVFVVRRRRPRAPAAPAAPGAVPAPVTEAPVIAEMRTTEPPPRLRVEVDTRRVFVNGHEARPPLSNEQFRLLSYLYERRGKVVPRDELVVRVWPDAHAEGVSEEALDALVRRVRERIVQAGGDRAYIVTLRGQGFRLEV